MIDPVAIGKRIRQARNALGLSQAALAKRLYEAELALGSKLPLKNRTKQPITKLTPQAIQHWERGSVVPPWDKVGLLAEVFQGTYTETWIMFGERRATQLRQERPFLDPVSLDEMELLSTFRSASEAGQAAMIGSCKAIAAANPAPKATAHPLRFASKVPTEK